MAQGTFEAQVEGLTGLTISSSGTSPTQQELTDFLVDGVRDVACRVLAIKPEEAELFSTTTSAINSASGTEIQSGVIISVVRANGDDSTKLNPAERISPNDRYRAKDTNSLHYRSKYNPAYYVSGKTVYIIPDPANNSNKDDAYITYVDYDTGIVYSDNAGAIDYFPDKYQGLVSLYAACRSLLNAMGATIASISDYTAPVISSTAAGGSAAADLTTMTDSNWTYLDYDFDDENIDYSTWFQAVGDMIQNQEDFELATAQLEKINAYLTAYQQSVSNSSVKFDKTVAKYERDYTWMSQRYQALYGEYFGYFNMMLGQQQAAQQQAAQAQQTQQGRGRRR